MNDLISRQAAIEIVDFECGEWRGLAKTITKRLSGLPSAQPETHEERTETHACDCISRQAAIDALHMHLMYRMGTDSNKKRLDEWINSLPSAQPEPKWIPCSERLPEPRMDVWTCSDIGQIQGYYEEHVGIWYASFGQGRDYLELYVTAWMPLPEPYQAERREK